ncbi:hypothetical protein ACPC0Q_19410 [Bacillus bombysepticus]
MENIFKPLQEIDWENVEEVNSTSRIILKKLVSDKHYLSELLDCVRFDSHLFGLCEHYDILDKIVLYDDKEHNFRIRLHIFLPGYYDRPHNHRWSYSSLILHGSYKHYFYGTDQEIHDRIDVNDLKPIMIREESQNSFYTLQHNMVHAVLAEPYTVSLIVRGPSFKERFLVMDRKTNQAWWQYGSKDETEIEKKLKTMTIERFDFATSKLKELNII